MPKFLMLIVSLVYSINVLAITRPLTSSCAVTCYKAIPSTQNYGSTLIDSNFLPQTTYAQCVAERTRLMNAAMERACPLPAGTAIIMGNPPGIDCALVWKKTHATDKQTFSCIP